MSRSFEYCTAADGARLGYRRLGDGPPMLLIAGLAGEAKFWDAVLGDLSQHYSVIVFDQRGYGASSNTDSPCRIELLAGDALAVLDAAGVDDAIVVGHSTGGAIAQTLALDHPARVSHLVLSSTWARADAYMRYLFALRSNVMRAGGRRLYADLTRVLGYPQAWLRERPDQLALAPAGARIDVDERLFPRVEALLAFDRMGMLATIRQPTLVLGACDDQIVPNYLHRELLDAIPGATGSFCGSGGHFFPSIAPETFVMPVHAWLGKRR